MDTKKNVYLAIIVIFILIILFMLRCNTKETAMPEKSMLTPPETGSTAEKKPAQATPMPAQVKPEGNKAAGYEFRKVIKDNGRVAVEVIKDGKKVFEKETGDRESIVFNISGENNRLPKAGDDLNGDKKPDVVLQLKSFKDSCSNIYSVYSLRGDLELVSEIKGLAEGIKFKDLDNDKVPEISGHDCTFLDWWASLGETPAPKVILRWGEGEYVFAEDLMRKNPPLESDMRSYLEKNKGKFISYVWKYMLDLIYTGNGDIAWEFYDMVEWDEGWEEDIMDDSSKRGVGNKADFLGAFKEHLSTSPYWENVKSFNNWEMLEVEL